MATSAHATTKMKSAMAPMNFRRRGGMRALLLERHSRRGAIRVLDARCNLPDCRLALLPADGAVARAGGSTIWSARFLQVACG
jgi:hypothetical protein